MLDIFCKSNLFPVSQSCFILLGYALKNGSSHFLNMKQLLTSSLNNKILYCHFTKCFVVLPVRNNASQFIFIVLGTVNFFFNLFCSLCCFSVQFNKKKKKSGLFPPTQKGPGWRHGHTGRGTFISGFVPCGQFHISYASGLFLCNTSPKKHRIKQRQASIREQRVRGRKICHQNRRMAEVCVPSVLWALCCNQFLFSHIFPLGIDHCVVLLI